MLSGIKKRKAPLPPASDSRKQSNAHMDNLIEDVPASASSCSMSETLDSFDNDVTFLSDLHKNFGHQSHKPSSSRHDIEYHLSLDIDDMIPQTVSPRARKLSPRNISTGSQHQRYGVSPLDKRNFDETRVLDDKHEQKQHGNSVNRKFSKEEDKYNHENHAGIDSGLWVTGCKQCQGAQPDSKDVSGPAHLSVHQSGKQNLHNLTRGPHTLDPFSIRQSPLDRQPPGKKQINPSSHAPTLFPQHHQGGHTQVRMDRGQISRHSPSGHSPPGHSPPGHLTTDIKSEPSLPVSWRVKPVHAWTTADVKQWCSDSGFVQFAHLFEDGKLLIQITAEDLVELGVTDPWVHQNVLHTIQKLVEEHPNGETEVKTKWLSSTAQSLSSSDGQQFKKTANRNTEDRKEPSMPLFGAGRRIALGRKRSNSVENLSFENERRAREQRRKSAGDVLTSDSRLVAHFTMWTNADVLKWIDSVGLQKYRTTFKAKNITGKEIVEIDAQFLETTMNIQSTSGRDFILSKLNKLQQGARSLSFDNLQEAYSVQDQPDIDTGDKKSGVTFLTPAEAPPVFKRKTAKMPGERKKKGGLSWLKEAISPLRFGHKQKEFDIIQLWHDITNTGLQSMISMRVHEAAPSVDIVRRFLEQNDTTDDPNLFCIEELKNGEGRELGRYECPLAVQRQWVVGVPNKFELKQKAGTPIKVICKITGLKPKGKTINVSSMSTCLEVLPIVLFKYNMRHVDTGLFCLLEIDRDTGDVQLVGDNDIIAELKTDSFIVCDKANMGMQLHSGAPASSYTSSSGGISRNESMLSKSSGKSFASADSSMLSSDSENNMKSKIEMEKLQSLEEEMAHIEASIDDYSAEKKRGLIEVKNISITSENLELFQELELMKSSMEERDILIQTLKEENSRLKQHCNQGQSLYNFLSKLDGFEVMVDELGSSLSELKLVDSLAGGTGEHGCLVVTNDSGRLKLGDIILEVDGRRALGISEGDLDNLVKTDADQSKELVFVRPLDRQSDQNNESRSIGTSPNLHRPLLDQPDLSTEVKILREKEHQLLGECCSLREQVQFLQREVQLQKLSTDTLVAKFV